MHIVDNFIAKSRNRVVLDTNIALLLLVGRTNRHLIGSFKRTNVLEKEPDPPADPLPAPPADPLRDPDPLPL